MEHHNFLRSLHDAPPLTVDKSLENSAMAWVLNRFLSQSFFLF